MMHNNKHSSHQKSEADNNTYVHRGPLVRGGTGRQQEQVYEYYQLKGQQQTTAEPPARPTPNSSQQQRKQQGQLCPEDEEEEQSEYTNDETGTDIHTTDQSTLYDEDYEEGDSYASSDALSSYRYVTQACVPDATRRVHEVHEQLLMLMSNPEDFAEVVHGSNADMDLLPYKIFAEDAEVVLPQALTASQLFGVEQTDGIELEAAAGIVPLSQLFLRWLGKKIAFL